VARYELSERDEVEISIRLWTYAKYDAAPCEGGWELGCGLPRNRCGGCHCVVSRIYGGDCQHSLAGEEAAIQEQCDIDERLDVYVRQLPSAIERRDRRDDAFATYGFDPDEIPF